MRCIIWVFFTFTLIAVSACNKPVQDYKQQAIGLLEQEKFNEAKSILDDGIEEYLDNAELYNLRGVCFFEMNQYQSAINDYQQSAKLDDQNYKPFYNLGNTYFNLNQHNKAIENFKKAKQLNPEESDIFLNLANSLVKTDQINDALENYKMAIDLNDESFLANINLAKIMVNQGNTKTALPYLKKCLKIDPDHAETYYYFALAHQKNGDNDAACLFWKKSRELGFTPENPLEIKGC